MALYPKIESIGSRGSIILAILEVQDYILNLRLHPSMSSLMLLDDGLLQAWVDFQDLS